MAQEDRRQFRRTRLRLRIARLDGLEAVCETGDLWTSNVSAGGMFFYAPLSVEPTVGTAVSFELTVPPGEGYSSSAGRARGSGKVVRTLVARGSGTGVAVQFTRPLALDF